MKKSLPYHTGKVAIGLHYEPPKKNYMSHEEEFWQSIILGERQIEQYLLRICYLMGAVAGLIMLVLWVALK